ncbi:fimbrial protein [Providencia sp. Je.9.19]|uniref:fimbrial protein n=1 Tax=Providencia sp. Je.9.19 TaxID=3142844 RepID=UPI003DA95EE1
MKKSLINILVIISYGVAYSKYAEATCTQNPAFKNVISDVPTTTYNINYTDMTVRELGQIATDVYVTTSPSYSSYDPSTTDNCGTAHIYYNFINGWNTNNNNSGIQGITISAVSSNGSLVPYHQQTPFVANQPPFNFRGNRKWILTIKKTGQVKQSGYIKSGYVAEMIQTNTNPKPETWYLGKLNIPENAIRINVISCSIKDGISSYDVTMGDWYDTQFTTIGSTNGLINIPITLTCIPGMNIKAKVTGLSEGANNILSLNGSDKATGIGIQILDKNNIPVIFEQDIDIQNKVPNGDYMFNWKARYIKTATNITPGTANATASVNIRYE